MALLDTLDDADSVVILVSYIFSMIICLFVLLKVYDNLYEISCCYLKFSDKHNWIIQPDDSTKITALVSPLFYVFGLAHLIVTTCLLVFNVIDQEIYSNLGIISNILLEIGNNLYFLYMVSTLQYHINQEALIECVVSKKVLISIKCIIGFNIFSQVVYNALLYFANYDFDFCGIPYVLMNYIILSLIYVIIEMILLYSYVKGLNNVCRYWYQQGVEEYKLYGETEKSHEVLIVITRCTVIVLISAISLVLNSFWCVIGLSFVYKNNPNITWNAIYYIWDIILSITTFLNRITYVISIYYVFDFGYSDYIKCCNCCHQRMYLFCRRKHQNEIQKGEYVNMNKPQIN